MQPGKLILDYVYAHESALGNEILLTQPRAGGEVIDYTWGELMDEARRMAAHLKGQGLPEGARIAILSKNCAHFIIAELAIWMAGFTTVAIFPTESAENVRFVLEHSEASLLFVGKLDNWPAQAPAVPAGVTCIALPLAAPAGFETWEAIIERTAPLEGQSHRRASDLAMLLYTSGSTGQPKGVMQNFESITRSTELALAHMSQYLPAGLKRRALSYLPLAHVYERSVVECGCLIEGVCRIFFTESLATFMEDLKRARPTAFCSVPRLWLKFQQSVLATISATALDALLDDPQTGPAVGRRVLAGLGLDEVRLAVSGSAPASPALLNWYRRLGLPMFEGYGMTEDFAYSHLTSPEMNLPGYVGVPVPGVEARIAPDGEILIKSPGQMVGYYKRPDLDRESFTEDRFFRTGDLGEQSPDGQLRITGRKKELFKTGKGKYVAPAPIENLLNSHPMVELAMVSGVGQPAPYAAVLLAEQLRAGLGDPDQRQKVEGELAKLLAEVNQSVASYEQLQFLVVALEPWSIENGCLTPTMKIKRSRIEARLAGQLEGWYARPGPVLWAQASA